MYHFAKYFDYDDPDMRYVTFDITGQDTSVIKLFLELYSQSANSYMQFETPEDARLYNAMLNESTKRLATKLANMIGPNQTPVPPPITGTFPVSSTWVPLPKIFDAYKEWDIHYFSKYMNVNRSRDFYAQYVWKKVGDYMGAPIETNPKDTLLVNAMKKVSFYNRSFSSYALDTVDGKRFYQYGVYAQENLYPNKIVKLLSRYNKLTNVLPAMLQDNKQLLACAYNRLRKWAGWSDIPKFSWSYKNAFEYVDVSYSASSGLRPGPRPSPIRVAPGLYKRVSVVGKKLEQIEYAAKVLDDAVKSFFETGIFELPQEHAKIVVKSEVVRVDSETQEAGEKAKEKAREYFIPDLVTIMLAQLVQGYRQKMERGHIIRIGLDWNQGGMYHFAKYFDYDDPDMRYVTFDITCPRFERLPFLISIMVITNLMISQQRQNRKIRTIQNRRCIINIKLETKVRINKSSRIPGTYFTRICFSH